MNSVVHEGSIFTFFLSRVEKKKTIDKNMIEEYTFQCSQMILEGSHSGLVRRFAKPLKG